MPVIDRSTRHLADALGIEPEYTDVFGKKHRISEETLKRMMETFGLKTDGSADALRKSLENFRLAQETQTLDPVHVLLQSRHPAIFTVRIPEEAYKKTFYWTLTQEDGYVHTGSFCPAELKYEGRIKIGSGHHIGQYRFQLPVHPPLGYHQFRLYGEFDGREIQGSMELIVAPERCYLPRMLTENKRIWGMAAQLYSVRSRRNWGIGDFTDLLTLVDSAAEHGAGVLGLNPLHALFPHNPEHASPYSPSSRLFFNVMYLDVEAIPDFSECESAQNLVFSPLFQEKLTHLREAEMIDYAGVAAVKFQVLEMLYQSFRERHLAKNSQWAQEFHAFVREGGKRLESFALFQALQERFHKEDPNVWGWLVWPETYRDPESGAVREFASANRERIEYYMYLQWQADTQLHNAGIRSLERRLPVGMYLDLAVGADRGGAEVWSNQDLYALDTAVGAPPDELNQKGQNWGLPPMIPERLRQAAYRPFIEILRENMKYAGALRIDHFMALMRLFWIPENIPCANGAYVRYPFEDMLAVLALESQRNQCLVIGEDLGTVPPMVREKMQEWGILSYKVFLFEKENEGDFKPPKTYTPQALVTLSTHDLPTLGGFWQGEDIQLRTELDLYPSKSLRNRQIKERFLERMGILAALEKEGLLPDETPMDPALIPVMTPELSRAIHVFLARTPSMMQVVQFEDILQQTTQVNMPGTVDEHPNWRRKLTVSLEDILEYKGFQMLVEALNEERESPALMKSEKTTGIRAIIPQATYRFQFNKSFTFKHATELVPYLSRLGISHCYASPLLTSRPGSPHGYDITNHKELDPEIGTIDEFNEFAATLKQYGISLILDLVPNHMGVGPDNPWWVDVLENGPASAYAGYFDIDWDPLKEELHGKVLIPILGSPYGQVLERGELHLHFDAALGKFYLKYYEHEFPINPLSYPMILEHRLEVLAARLGNTNPVFLEYQSILTALKHLPVHTEHDPERMQERIREKNIAARRLSDVCQQSIEITEFIQENLSDFEYHKDNPANRGRLHRLLEAQAYRLAFWRVALDEINYRRFFDINHLAGVRIEDFRVFNDTHQLILELVSRGQLHGVRIDHPDGLYDPGQYFQRFQEHASRALGQDIHLQGTLLSSVRLPFYMVVEKILAPFEKLPETWAVHGTTGYEFANAVNGLFVDSRHEKEFTRIYQQFIGREIDFEELVYHCKMLIMRTSMTSEMSVLAHHLNKISETDWGTRDFTLNSLRNALMEVVACFPVYRTYIAAGEVNGDFGFRVSKEDRKYVHWAISLAKKRSTAIDTSIFDFIQNILLLNFGPEKDEDYRRTAAEFAMKFQQYTGPVMAKGMEDTAFYRFNRLVSLNEVGGEPDQFGLSVALFHYKNQERARRVPYTLLNTSTHDTKRSEDVRARIDVISEIPDEWHQVVYQWSEMNQCHKTAFGDTLYPDRNDEYLFYQTLVGVWPLYRPGEIEHLQLLDRIENYMLKAIRESKVHTSWINTNAEYEEAMLRFIRRALSAQDSPVFLDNLQVFLNKVTRPGLMNSVSQTVLKLTVPGIPDIYQGTETWDFSLVDPDNRRPVDFAALKAMLSELEPALEPDISLESRKKLLKELLDSMENGKIKQFLTVMLLNFRKNHSNLFRKGEYLPVHVEGTMSDHVVAFARRYKGQSLLVIVPRMNYKLMSQGQGDHFPVGEDVWADTRLLLPASLQRLQWKNVLTHEAVKSSGDEMMMKDVFTDFPVAVLDATLS